MSHGLRSSWVSLALARFGLTAVGALLLAAVGWQGASPDAGEARQTSGTLAQLELQAIVESPLGPSFSITNGTIAGRAYAFLGSAAGVVVLEWRSPTSAIEVGRLLTRGAPQGLFVFGNDLLFASGGAGSSVIDVSDPKRPTEVAFLPTRDEARDAVFDPARKMALVIDYTGLALIDLSNPRRPVTVGSLPAVAAPSHLTLDAARKLALVVGDSASVAAGGSLRLIDVSNARRPVEVGALDLPGRTSGVAYDPRRRVAFVAGARGQSGGGRLQVVDISAPKSPAVLGTVDTPATVFGVAIDPRQAVAITVGDGVERNTGSLRVIDVADPRRPLDIGGLKLPSRALSVVIDGRNNRALVPGGYGLLIARFDRKTRRCWRFQGVDVPPESWTIFANDLPVAPGLASDRARGRRDLVTPAANRRRGATPGLVSIAGQAGPRFPGPRAAHAKRRLAT